MIQVSVGLKQSDHRIFVVTVGDADQAGPLQLWQRPAFCLPVYSQLLQPFICQDDRVLVSPPHPIQNRVEHQGTRTPQGFESSDSHGLRQLNIAAAARFVCVGA